MSFDKAILFLLPDCPGYFTELFFKMGAAVKEQGFIPVFAATTPFYERFKKVKLSTVGPVYYLDEFLQRAVPEKDYAFIPVNNWSKYASHVRQTYFWGGPLNNTETFKKTKLFFQHIYDQHNVVLQVSEGVSNAFLYLAHEQGETNNIPYYGLMGARIPYHFNVHMDVIGNKVMLNPAAPEQYTPANDVPDYMKNSQFGGLFDKGYSFFSLSFVKELLDFLFMKSATSMETGNTKRFLLIVYKIAFRRIIADYYFKKLTNLFEPTVKFRKDKIYVVYPLHFYPEASTSVFARHYDGNEFNLIKNIAFSLPENAVLVVKEHKANVGNNNKAFYKKIKALPNVVLLTPYYNLKENLHHFDAVVTISSTVGFEALTMDVPVYVLGDVFYQHYPGSTKIGSYAELEAKLSNLKKQESRKEPNQTFNLYVKISFPGSFNYMSPSCLNKQNVELLLQPAITYLQTGKLPTMRTDVPITKRQGNLAISSIFESMQDV